MALVSIDAAQWYDQVNLFIMSLIWHALRVHQPAIAIIISCFTNMKIYTRTCLRDSDSYIGSPNNYPLFCRLGQGSNAAPALWIQLSTMIINSFCKYGCGAEFVDPITYVSSHSIDCMYLMTQIYTQRDNCLLWHNKSYLRWWKQFHVSLILSLPLVAQLKGPKANGIS